MTPPATDSPPHDRPRFRLTTGSLMVWIFAVAAALGVMKGDLVSWVLFLLPPQLANPLAFLLFFGTVFAIAVGIPWLGHQADRSRNPAVRKPLTDRERHAEHLITLSLLGLLTAAFILVGVMAYQVIVPGS